MVKLLLILFLLVSACVATHCVGMILGITWLRKSWPRHAAEFTLSRVHWLLIRVVYGLLVLHLIQIVIWAAVYRAEGCFPDFATSFYFSATSYSTVGYGDVMPDPEWRILGAVEAITGVIMFGWSTGVLFSVVHQLYSRFFTPRALPHPAGDETGNPTP